MAEGDPLFLLLQVTEAASRFSFPPPAVLYGMTNRFRIAYVP